MAHKHLQAKCVSLYVYPVFEALLQKKEVNASGLLFRNPK